MMVSKILPKLWTPRLFLDQLERTAETNRYALIVLNRPVNTEPAFTVSLWNSASIRVLVDGGANRWLSFCDALNRDTHPNVKIADRLTGDFDSVTPETRSRLAEMGTSIIPTPDQDHTDYTKALHSIKTFTMQNDIQSIVTLVDTSGRVDHIMANINTMCKTLEMLPGVNLYSIGRGSMAWLLEPGEHVIEIPEELVRQGRWCSYVPIKGACRVWTTGFKWDLEGHRCEFGGMVSTSNTYASQRITIRTDGLLYWSMGIGEIADDE